MMLYELQSAICLELKSYCFSMYQMHRFIKITLFRRVFNKVNNLYFISS